MPEMKVHATPGGNLGDKSAARGPTDQEALPVMAARSCLML